MIVIVTIIIGQILDAIDQRPGAAGRAVGGAAEAVDAMAIFDAGAFANAAQPGDRVDEERRRRIVVFGRGDEDALLRGEDSKEELQILGLMSQQARSLADAISAYEAHRRGERPK